MGGGSWRGLKGEGGDIVMVWEIGEIVFHDDAKRGAGMLLFYKKVTKKLLSGRYREGLADCYLL